MPTPGTDRGGRRLSAITLDQAVAGGSNVLVAVLAARTLGVESFGHFGIVFLVYVSVQGVARALVCEPLLVHHVEAKERPGEAIGTSLVIGAVLGGVVVLTGLGTRLFEADVGSGLVVLGLLFPLLALQDLGRYLGFATQRPSYALVVDVTWFVLVLVTTAVVLVLDARTLTWFVAAWVGSGALAGLLVLGQHATDRVRFGPAWLRQTWRFSWRYLLSFALGQSGVLGATIALSALSGAQALAGVRGALLLMSAAVTFQIAAGAFGVAAISRVSGSRQVRSQARRITALSAGVAVLNGVVLVLPDRVGEAVLGDTWAVAEPLLLPAWLQTVLLGVVVGAKAGLLGTRAVRKTLALDLACTPVLVTLAVVGTLLGDAEGYLWGVVIGQAVVIAMWWGVLHHHLRAGGAADVPATPPAVTGQPPVPHLSDT